MSKNVGTIDRVVRVVIGLALIALLFLAEGSIRWLGLAGAVLLVTGVFSFCPAYRLVGLSTCARCASDA